MELTDFSKLKKRKRKAEEKNDLKELGNVCNALGELLSEYGHHEEAIAEHELDREISEKLQDKIGEAVACRKIGECYCKLGQFDKALKLQNRYLTLAQECCDQVEIQRALATLGDTYYTQADMQGAGLSRLLLNEAEKKFLQALHVCENLHGSSSLSESEYMAMKGRLLLNLGLVYDLRGAERESTEYLQKALAIAKQWNLLDEEYLCHFNAASQALRRGQATSAGFSLQQALTLATRLHNKLRQKEVFCLLAVATVIAGDIRSAKHLLKKAYKLLPIPDESEKIIKLFKSVSIVERLKEKKSACDQDDKEMFHIHEKLGDAFTDIGLYCGSYFQAIHHYQQMVDCGERLGLGSDKLIPAYVSLAQTYADNQQPDQAISSYHKELLLRAANEHQQICRTWLNIADLEERRGDNYKLLSKSYMTAYSHAKKSNHPKLQIEVLRSLVVVQTTFKERHHKEQTEVKLQQLLTKHGLSLDDCVSDGEEVGSQHSNSEATPLSDQDTDFSISDLTDSDEENVPLALSQSVSSARVHRRKNFKKNEKGETPLHLACISGNLKRVKSLLSEGHPVNVRDHCGWTPLHEASNHDHPEVVKALLAAGADINDRGGIDCNGFTPLIDSAACGNVGVMKLLIQHGANILAKDDKGCTALQALMNWHRNYGDTLSADDQDTFHFVLQALQEKGSSIDGDEISRLSSRGVSSFAGTLLTQDQPQLNFTVSPSFQSAQHSQKSSRLSSNQSHIPRTRHTETLSSEEEDEEKLYQNPHLEEMSSCSQTATDAYRMSILALGSSSQRAKVCSKVTKAPSPFKSPKPALIDEQNMVGDDWLINDVQPGRRKRRDRGHLSNILFSDSIRSVRQRKRARLTLQHIHQKPNTKNIDGDESVTKDVVEGNSDGESRVPSLFTTSSSMYSDPVAVSRSASCSDEDDSLPLLHRNVRRVESTESSLDLHREEAVPSNSRAEQEERSGAEYSFPGEAQIQCGPALISPSATPARVKVKIEGTLFLIPLPAAEEKTVRWLTVEASERYCSHFNRRPLLTLSSSDGAILSSDDVLATVLSPDEQLEGTVYGWDQPALSERYAQASRTLGTVKYRNISDILKAAETSHRVCLSGLGLHCLVLKSIIRALQSQSLQELHLPDNHLGDDGLENLVKVLVDLQNLTHLNLANNAITANGLKYLAALVSANSTAVLKALTSLDLSHNPLGSSIADSLCSIVRGLSSLTVLSLSSCQLTAALFQHNRPVLAACLQGSGLQELNVSHNNLGTLGVELLLRSVNVQKLSAIDLSHTSSESSPGYLAMHLKLFLNQGCALQRLSLEGCGLHLEDVEFLCRLPIELPGLQRLNVSLNRAVTTDSLQRILHNSAQCADSQLQHLEAESCSVASPLSVCSSTCSERPSFLHSLRDKLSCPHPLQHLKLTCKGLNKEDSESLFKVWTRRWTQAVVCRNGQSVLLTLLQS